MEDRLNCSQTKKKVLSIFYKQFNANRLFQEKICQRNNGFLWDTVENNYLSLLVKNSAKTVGGCYVFSTLADAIKVFWPAQETFGCQFVIHYKNETNLAKLKNSICTLEINLEAKKGEHTKEMDLVDFGLRLSEDGESSEGDDESSSSPSAMLNKAVANDKKREEKMFARETTVVGETENTQENEDGDEEDPAALLQAKEVIEKAMEACRKQQEEAQQRIDQFLLTKETESKKLIERLETAIAKKKKKEEEAEAERKKKEKEEVAKKKEEDEKAAQKKIEEEEAARNAEEVKKKTDEEETKKKDEQLREDAKKRQNTAEKPKGRRKRSTKGTPLEDDPHSKKTKGEIVQPASYHCDCCLTNKMGPDGFTISGDAEEFKKHLSDSRGITFKALSQNVEEKLKSSLALLDSINRYLINMLKGFSGLPVELSPKTGTFEITCRGCPFHCGCGTNLSGTVGRPIPVDEIFDMIKKLIKANAAEEKERCRQTQLENKIKNVHT